MKLTQLLSLLVIFIFCSYLLNMFIIRGEYDKNVIMRTNLYYKKARILFKKRATHYE